jgi:hypothetical protein
MIPPKRISILFEGETQNIADVGLRNITMSCGEDSIIEDSHIIHGFLASSGFDKQAQAINITSRAGQDSG